MDPSPSAEGGQRTKGRRSRRWLPLRADPTEPPGSVRPPAALHFGAHLVPDTPLRHRGHRRVRLPGREDLRTSAGRPVAVADAFRRNFADGKEVGAACAVYRDGVKVVDLWGGYRNGLTREPWQENTLVPVYSATKGIASLAVAVAHARGLLSYDERVAAYWPEFGEAGKSDVTVRQLLSHQAGLPVIDRPLKLAHLADPQLCVTVDREPRGKPRPPESLGGL
ncbi:serine hydrolase domain-containing protein [Streptomyces sp. NBC_00445]|uniref:serine hydrolase domain-containing protein n=1 Tax=Streptomyces sp. NBC_00445 TaxID=2975745 RepID=UPI002E1D802A